MRNKCEESKRKICCASYLGIIRVTRRRNEYIYMILQ